LSKIASFPNWKLCSYCCLRNEKGKIEDNRCFLDQGTAWKLIGSSPREAKSQHPMPRDAELRKCVFWEKLVKPDKVGTKLDERSAECRRSDGKIILRCTIAIVCDMVPGPEPSETFQVQRVFFLQSWI
jgi:hypothetical protein